MIKKSDLNLVDLTKVREESKRNSVPKVFIKTLEDALEAAKDGRLSSISLYGNWGGETGTEEEQPGKAVLWTANGNVYELIGQIEFLKAVALEGLLEKAFVADDGEE